MLSDPDLPEPLPELARLLYARARAREKAKLLGVHVTELHIKMRELFIEHNISDEVWLILHHIENVVDPQPDDHLIADAREKLSRLNLYEFSVIQALRKQVLQRVYCRNIVAFAAHNNDLSTASVQNTLRAISRKFTRNGQPTGSNWRTIVLWHHLVTRGR